MNKSIKLIFNYLLAPVLFIVLCWSLYHEIASQNDLPQRWAQVKESWKTLGFWIVFILMFLNWGIEAKKWQLLISPLEKFSFLKAYKSVLTGCSVTMLTPNRIGEYGGRIIYVEKKNRYKAISVTILGSMTQLFVTMVIGLIGLMILRLFPPEDRLLKDVSFLTGNWLLFFSAVFTVFLALLYIRMKGLIMLLEKIPSVRPMVNHIKIIEEFSGKQMLRILFFSFSRYMVFILQYALLLNVLDINVSIFLSFWLLTIFYLVLAVAPTIGFLELPIRATASVELFQAYSSNIIGIQAVSFGIWLINLVIPAILGSILIFGIKIFKDK